MFWSLRISKMTPLPITRNQAVTSLDLKCFRWTHIETIHFWMQSFLESRPSSKSASCFPESRSTSFGTGMMIAFWLLWIAFRTACMSLRRTFRANSQNRNNIILILMPRVFWYSSYQAWKKKTKAWSRTCKWLGEKSIVIFNADARATYVTTYVVRCYGHTNAD